MAKKKYSKKKANKKDSQIKSTISKQTKSIEEKNLNEENKFKPYLIFVNEKGGIFFKASNDDSDSSKIDLDTMSKDEIAKHINGIISNDDDNESRVIILKELAIFKNFKKTLELELRKYEAFMKSIIFIVTILSFAISSILNMIKIDNPIVLPILILIASIVYMAWGGKYAVKIVDKKDGTGRLDVVEYAINVLEIKLEELDRDERKNR